MSYTISEERLTANEYIEFFEKDRFGVAVSKRTI